MKRTLLILLVASALVTADRAASGCDEAPAVTLSSWRVCRSFRFNGVDEYVSVSDHESLRLSSLTLAAWVRSGDANQTQPIVGKVADKGNWMSYMLRIQDGGKVSLVLGNAAEGREIHWRTKVALASDKWHHVAATWSNERGDATDAVIYMDGVAQETEVIRDVKYANDFHPGYTDGALLIGRDQYPSGHFKGQIEEVYIGPAMSEKSVRELMQSSPGRGAEVIGQQKD